MVNVDNIDYEKPIFAMYIDIDGLSMQKAQSVISDYLKMLQNSDITVMVLPRRGESKIECIYAGKYHNLSDDKLDKFVKNMDKVGNFTKYIDDSDLDEHSKSTVKEMFRAYKLTNLLDDE